MAEVDVVVREIEDQERASKILREAGVRVVGSSWTGWEGLLGRDDEGVQLACRRFANSIPAGLDALRPTWTDQPVTVTSAVPRSLARRGWGRRIVGLPALLGLRTGEDGSWDWRGYLYPEDSERMRTLDGRICSLDAFLHDDADSVLVHRYGRSWGGVFRTEGGTVFTAASIETVVLGHLARHGVRLADPRRAA